MTPLANTAAGWTNGPGNRHRFCSEIAGQLQQGLGEGGSDFKFSSSQTAVQLAADRLGK
jgi:hypothetical protein